MDRPRLPDVLADDSTPGGPSPKLGRMLLVLALAMLALLVLQTVLGLLDAGRRVYVVEDAVGSRRAANKTAALHRMARHGAEIVTTEMVVFEWLVTAEHPRFREVIALVK